MRMLIAYAIIVPLAVIVGYLLANPLDYSTVGFLGIMFVILISPVFIKWHYPILIFGLSCPATCFFLPGKPPMAQVVVSISLLIAVTERILNSEKRFLRVSVMTWPLLFLVAVIVMTASLTGGIKLHSMGGESGGGRKYIEILLGIATYFALTSREIPRNHWKWYLMLYLLSPLLGVFSQLFPYLPSPLNYINLLFPPQFSNSDAIVIGQTRLVSFSFAVATVVIYMLARYGLRGMFIHWHPGRAVIFVGAFLMTMLGGFRNIFGGTMLTMGLMFYFDRLYRTRLLPLFMFAGIFGLTVLIAFSDQLPFTFQRSMAFLPLKWKPEVIMDAQGSTDWRLGIWRDTWPKVPQYLLLGKGYGLSEADYEMLGEGTFARYGASHVDASQEGLAIAGDYHSGPLSTLMPFGVWGGIGICWLMGATLFVTYRNNKYGDLELKAFNVFALASCISSIVAFFFIVGAFNNAMGYYGGLAGFSIALNGGLVKRPAKTASNPLIKPPSSLPSPVPQTARAVG